MPKVSVVIPCYNHGDFLPETLSSVWEQTLDDYEVIIVNDGSTDPATIDVLNHIDNSRARVIHTVNHGVSAARNRGISEAGSKYILPLDADDKIAPTYLEKAVAVLDVHQEVSIVFGERIMFGELNGTAPLPPYNIRQMLVENLIYPASMFRKEDWSRVGGYCEAMTYGWEDWEFWISIAHLGGSVVKLPEPMFFYRVRSTSRDYSLRFMKKIAMFSLIVWRHKARYVKNAFYVFGHLVAHFLKTPWFFS